MVKDCTGLNKNFSALTVYPSAKLMKSRGN